MTGDRTRRGLTQRLRKAVAHSFPAGSAAGQWGRKIAVATEDALAAFATPALMVWDGRQLARAWWRGGPGIGKAAAGRTIVMLVVSQIHVDPRVRQEAQALAAAGYEITIMWPELATDIGRPIDWGDGISFQRLPTRAGRFAYRFPGFLGTEMLAAAMAHRPFAFHGHDLTTAMVAMIAARRTGAHAVCDFHEWFSEQVTWSNWTRSYVPLSRGRRHINKWLERRCLAEASAVITVCNSIAEEMEHAFEGGQRRVHVVRNIPEANAEPSRAYRSLRDELCLSDDKFIVLYQGGIGPSRALEPVIAALAQVPACVLVIRGPSIADYAAHYRQVATSAGVNPGQLVLLPAVPSTDVVAACRGADAGLYTVADLCKSFRYALPNKIFEYMRADLPILTADFPEVRGLAVDTGVGLAFDPQCPDSIAAAISAMTDPVARSDMRRRLPAVLAALDADHEWTKLVRIYDTLVRDGRRPTAAAARGRMADGARIVR